MTTENTNWGMVCHIEDVYRAHERRGILGVQPTTPDTGHCAICGETRPYGHVLLTRTSGDDFVEAPLCTRCADVLATNVATFGEATWPPNPHTTTTTGDPHQ